MTMMQSQLLLMFLASMSMVSVVEAGGDKARTITIIVSAACVIIVLAIAFTCCSYYTCCRVNRDPHFGPNQNQQLTWQFLWTEPGNKPSLTTDKRETKEQETDVNNSEDTESQLQDTIDPTVDPTLDPTLDINVHVPDINIPDIIPEIETPDIGIPGMDVPDIDLGLWKKISGGLKKPFLAIAKIQLWRTPPKVIDRVRFTFELPAGAPVPRELRRPDFFHTLMLGQLVDATADADIESQTSNEPETETASTIAMKSEFAEMSENKKGKQKATTATEGTTKKKRTKNNRVSPGIFADVLQESGNVIEDGIKLLNEALDEASESI
eukprot:m.269401 g.269401  ORF g.269401 m.269401 type:complete len:324 (-) comp83915_c0_seq1:478-1449(-)